MADYPPFVPYLSVADADAAIDFYRRAFGATEKLRVPGSDRRIMHAEVVVGEALIMLTDSAPELGFPAAEPDQKVPVGLMVQWPSAAEVDRLHEQAVAAGGTSETAPRDEPWGRPLRCGARPIRPSLVAIRHAASQASANRDKPSRDARARAVIAAEHQG